MIVSVDLASPLPPYEQLRAQVAAMAASGVLPADSRLPSIRQLANDLDIAPGTVARAYRELEAEGVVATRGRHGTFIVRAPTLSAQEKRRRLAEAAATYASTIRNLGIESEEAMHALGRAMQTG